MRYIGLDLGASKLAGVALDSRQIVARDWRDVPTATSAAAVIETMRQMCERIIGSRQADVAAVGLGVPGIVSADGKTVLVAPNRPALNNLELACLLSAKISLPVIMDNDVRAAALGELRYGKAGDSFVFISLGTGIGSAIVEKGEVLRGHGAELSAGEIGHMRLREDKTFEQLASQRFLATTSFPTITAFLTALASDDPAIREIAAALARGIGEGLGNTINMLDPVVIVLAGGLANAWPKLEVEARTVIRSVVLSSEAQETPIRRATFGDYAGAVGAAILASTYSFKV